MATTIGNAHEYRMRDFILAVAVLALGAAFVSVLHLGDDRDAGRLALVALVLALALPPVTCVAAVLFDTSARRFPALTRSRRFSRTTGILFFGTCAAAALRHAAADEIVAKMFAFADEQTIPLVGFVLQCWPY